jgi:hypothetical protein
VALSAHLTGPLDHSVMETVSRPVGGLPLVAEANHEKFHSSNKTCDFVVFERGRERAREREREREREIAQQQQQPTDSSFVGSVTVCRNEL